MSSSAPRTVLCYLDHLGMGGVERVVLNLLEGLQQSGWSSMLALNGVKGELLGALPAGVPLLDLKAASFPAAVQALHRAIRESQADIVLSSRSYLNSIAALARLGTPAKLVLAEHTLLTEWWKNDQMPKRRADQLLRWLLPLVYRMGDTAVGVSQGVVQDLERALRMPGRVRLLNNPILPENLEELSLAPIPWEKEGPVILAVGRLSHEKGFDLLIRALRSIRLPVHLVLVGDGPERPRLQQLAEGLPVSFMGYQANPYPWIRRARVLALSSLIESFPTVLIEAMALGKPVVAFDCPVGPREIIRHEENGLLVPPQDPSALARALERILLDPGLAQRLGANGQRYAENFGFQQTTQAYEALFHSLLEKRGGHEHSRHHEPVDGWRSGAFRRQNLE